MYPMKAGKQFNFSQHAKRLSSHRLLYSMHFFVALQGASKRQMHKTANTRVVFRDILFSTISRVVVIL